MVTSTLPGLSKKAEKLLLIRRKNSRFVNVSVDVLVHFERYKFSGNGLKYFYHWKVF